MSNIAISQGHTLINRVKMLNIVGHGYRMSSMTKKNPMVLVVLIQVGVKYARCYIYNVEIERTNLVMVCY